MSKAMTPELAAWCNQIEILRYIELEKFADSFSDGVLFYYLAQQLFPEMTEELARLSGRINRVVADSDYFGKLDNWKVLGSMVLEQLEITRSEWFLRYLARGRDGYIHDLLDDLKKTVPNPPGGVHYQTQQPASYQTADDGETYVDETCEVQDDSSNQQPAFSFYHTPLNGEHEVDNAPVRHRVSYRTTRRFSNKRDTSVQDRQRGSQGQHYQQQPLRRIQHRNGNFGNKNRTNFRYFRNNRHGNGNSYRMNQWSAGGNDKAQSWYQRYLIPRDPRPDPMRSHTKQAWNQHQQYQQQGEKCGEQITEQDTLNQRFNELQVSNGDAYGSGTYRKWTPEFDKYFYKYYVQFTPVSCNYCTDNNLKCECPRFGLEQYYQYKKNRRGNKNYQYQYYYQ